MFLFIVCGCKGKISDIDRKFIYRTNYLKLYFFYLLFYNQTNLKRKKNRKMTPLL